MIDERRALLPGTLEMLVLKTLSRGALHGYQIAKAIQERTKDVLQVEEGTLYPALHRMERRGWIDAEWGPSESNRRAKFYALTKDGRAELKSRAADWDRVSTAIARVMEARSAVSE